MKDNLHHKQGKNAAAFDDIPEGYFNQLQDRVNHRIQREAEQARQRQKKYFSVAALFLLFFALGFAGVYFFNHKNVTHDQTAFEKVLDSEDLLTFEFSAVEYITGLPPANQDDINADGFRSDTLLNDMLSDLEPDDIILYLFEKNEYEF